MLTFLSWLFSPILLLAAGLVLIFILGISAAFAVVLALIGSK